VQVNGKADFDSAAVAKREEAMVKNALASGPVTVIICGGAHDLTAAIRTGAGNGCEYLRVVVQGYAAVAPEK